MNQSYSKYLTIKNKNTTSQNVIQPSVAALWSPSSSVNYAPNTLCIRTYIYVCMYM